MSEKIPPADVVANLDQVTTKPVARAVRGALSESDAAFARDLAARAAAVDGVAPMSEQSVLAIGWSPDPSTSSGGGEGPVHLLTPHGYANVTLPPAGGAATVEGVVDPDHRGNGEGAILMAAALSAARGVGDEPPQLWSHGDLPAAAALTASLGLTRVRELLQLRRPLAGLPPLRSRPGVVVRTYRGPEDDDEILRVNNAAFDWHPEQGGWTRSQIDERTGAAWFDPDGLFLAFDADDPDHLLGFHWTKVHDDAADPRGEVYIVGVDPAAQGRGLGSLLTLAGLHHLAERGLDTVELYVEGDNTAALATYGRLGFTKYMVDVAYRG